MQNDLSVVNWGGRGTWLRKHTVRVVDSNLVGPRCHFRETRLLNAIFVLSPDVKHPESVAHFCLSILPDTSRIIRLLCL